MKELRVIIAGKRDFNDFGRLCRYCDNILKVYKKSFDIITIISGNALGTDRMGEEYAKLRGYNLMIFPAEWFKYGRRAGIIRNAQMADYATSNGVEGILIAFWNGLSKGTGNMIEQAQNKHMDVFIDTITEEEK